ncbi:hypothetical protein H2198_005167 [Neophaeococcomyces mojaviensis]|uniref:Uncharacterized protein n=1 Tax=Neophaeococcomyces mojaviensis TaxID=3383035 RepID=A0ACC3A779_9EURO|nr:hypothetical protein H2198_005167 [Knufia sp. JES_112]
MTTRPNNLNLTPKTPTPWLVVTPSSPPPAYSPRAQAMPPADPLIRTAPNPPIESSQSASNLKTKTRPRQDNIDPETNSPFPFSLSPHRWSSTPNPFIQSPPSSTGFQPSKSRSPTPPSGDNNRLYDADAEETLAIANARLTSQNANLTTMSKFYYSEAAKQSEGEKRGKKSEKSKKGLLVAESLERMKCMRQFL